MSLHDVWTADVLGVLAGTLTTFAFVPQLLRIVRTRSADDISWLMFITFTAGVVLWLCYGIAVRAMPLIAANAVTLALAIAILGLKWRYGSPARASTRARRSGRGPQESNNG